MRENSRIYLVSDLDAADEDPARHVLVEAANQAQAIRHVVRKRFTADVAQQRTLVELTENGIKVQRATAEAQA